MSSSPPLTVIPPFTRLLFVSSSPPGVGSTTTPPLTVTLLSTHGPSASSPPLTLEPGAGVPLLGHLVLAPEAAPGARTTVAIATIARPTVSTKSLFMLLSSPCMEYVDPYSVSGITSLGPDQCAEPVSVSALLKRGALGSAKDLRRRRDEACVDVEFEPAERRRPRPRDSEPCSERSSEPCSEPCAARGAEQVAEPGSERVTESGSERVGEPRSEPRSVRCSGHDSETFL